MLFLYQSNRLEQLGQLYAAMLRAQPLTDPFAAETVIVQSRGMGRWMTLDLAQQCGIAANIDFVLPAAFAWRLMQRVMPALPRKSSFSPEVLTWRLLELLPTLQGEVFAPLQRYAASGEAAAFELAGKVADIFDQYLVFRPDWIRAWEAGEWLDLGEDEAWQAALWQQLAAQDPSRHRVRMLDEFFAELQPQHLPERITLFGIASLAPMYLALIKRLAELTDVCLFTLNPCEAYWGDIVDSRRKLKLREKGDLFATEGHPLLASLGKQGRDFFELIAADAELDARPLFAAPTGDTLLARLQRDILQLQMPGEDGQWLAEDDGSVELHTTHGPMRELEVLKDRLLAMLADDPSLSSADIAVLTPDINSYAPYIDAVFGKRDDAPSLPYAIADRQVEREEPLLAAISTLLQLLDSRFAADQVLALLDSPALLQRFGLQAEHLPFIQDWVRQSGIRWGRDAAHKAALGLPADPLFTWRWGLDRLLLGSILPAAMAGDDSGLFTGLLPQGGAGGQLAEVLACFASCYAVLDELANSWASPTDASGWAERLLQAVDRLFAVDDDGELALDVVRDALQELVEDAAMADFAQPFSLQVLRDWLQRKLTVASPLGFLSGGITFCAMVPMRSIPFRVLCLIGMNDGAYPRDERPVSFDLVARHPRRGDRSRRFDDRYLFLEAILSARQRLYLSYVGLSARNNEPLPPSALIAELLDCFQAMCGDEAAGQLLVRHPLQPFSPRSYDGRDQRLASFDPSFASALAAPPAQPQPFASALPLPQTSSVVHVNDFIRFWKNPPRAWLAERLAIRLHGEAEALPVREPFSVDRDASRTMRTQLVERILAGKPVAPVQQRLLGAGLLPPAQLGLAWLDSETASSARLAHRLPAVLTETTLPPVPVSLTLHGITLAGELGGLRREGQIRLVIGKMNAAERLEWWLVHLLLSATRPAGIACQSILYDDSGHYRLDDEPDAITLLEAWVVRWQQGQQQPLPFFGRTSWAYAEQLYKQDDAPQLALEKALDKWDPSFVADFASPQCEEPVNRLVFRHLNPLADPLFAQLAETLLLPLLARLEGQV